MKILLLNQTFYPDTAATARVLWDLATLLKQRGHTVGALAGQRGYDDRSVVYPAIENYQGIEIRRVPSTGFGKKNLLARILDLITFDLALIFKFFRVSRPDAVISFTSPPLVGVLGTLYCKFRGCLNIQWLMDINPDAAFAVGYLRRNSVIGKVLSLLLKYSLKQADCVVVLDRWMKKTVMEKGVLEEKVVIIPPWTSVSNQRRVPGVFRKKYDLEGKYLVTYSGNHSVVHPLDTLLETARALKDNPEVRFLFIGWGLRVVDVLQFKERYALENVFYFPRLSEDEWLDAFAATDLHVVITGNSVTGLVHTSKIYGVLTDGKPFLYLGPKESNVSDLMALGVHGYPVEHGNSRLAAETIFQVRNLEKSMLEKIAVDHRRVVEARFTAEKAVSPLMEVLDC